MGITWNGAMRKFVASLLIYGADGMKEWGADERDLYERLRLAGHVSGAGELHSSLYKEAIQCGLLAVQTTFHHDTGRAVFMIYASQVHGGGALTQPIGVSAYVREAVALGLVTGRFILKHAQSGDYEVVAR